MNWGTNFSNPSTIYRRSAAGTFLHIRAQKLANGSLSPILQKSQCVLDCDSDNSLWLVPKTKPGPVTGPRGFQGAGRVNRGL